jgi:outer membrane receptor for ferrienterochelin and colicins
MTVRLGGAITACVLLTAVAVANAQEELATEPSAPADIAAWDLESLLEETVVTGTGNTQSRSVAPAKITTWKRDEILQHGWTTLAEILAYTPGLYVVDDGVIPSVGVRGVSGGLRSGTRIIRIMINGVEVSFRPDLTAFIGPEFLPVDAIERVEIAKGPLSALYGANAFLATVNVITNRPVEGLSGRVAGMGQLINGNFGYGGSGVASYGSERFDVMVAIAARHIDRSGYNLHRTFAAEDPASATYRGFFDTTSRDDVARPQSLYASAKVKLGTGSAITLQGGRQVVDSQGEFQPASVLTHDNRVALANNWADAQYKLEHDIYKLTVDVSGGIGAPTHNEQLSANDDANFYYKRNFGYHALTAKANLDVMLPWSMQLRVGAEYLFDHEDILYYSQIYRVPLFARPAGFVHDEIRPGVDRGENLTNAAGYAQIDGSPITSLPGLYVFANGRVDTPKFFNTQLSWRAGGAYEIASWWVTKLFVGRAFQTPSAVQLFAQPGFGADLNIIGSRTLPSLPALEPQSVISAELANTVAFGEHVSVEQSIFYQHLHDKIELAPIAGNFAARNLDALHTAGADIELRVQVDRFRGFANLSGQAQTFVRNNGSTTFSTQGPQAFPSFQAALGVAGNFPELYTIADVTTLIVGERGSSDVNNVFNSGRSYTLPAYATVNVTLSSTGIRIIPHLGETHFIVSAANVGNAHYSQPGHIGVDIANTGRRFLLRVAQAF